MRACSVEPSSMRVTARSAIICSLKSLQLSEFMSWEGLRAGHASENRLPRQPQQEDHAAGRLRGSLNIQKELFAKRAWAKALGCLQRFALLVQRELRLILEERVGTDLGGTKPHSGLLLVTFRIGIAFQSKSVLSRSWIQAKASPGSSPARVCDKDFARPLDSPSPHAAVGVVQNCEWSFGHSFYMVKRLAQQILLRCTWKIRDPGWAVRMTRNINGCSEVKIPGRMCFAWKCVENIQHPGDPALLHFGTWQSKKQRRLGEITEPKLGVGMRDVQASAGTRGN